MALQPVILDQDVSALDISRFAQRGTKCCNTAGKGTGCPTMNKSDNRHRRLLRARRERPRRRAAEQRDELAALHSITSSARASSVGGTSRPSALAVLRLMIRSYF